MLTETADTASSAPSAPESAAPARPDADGPDDLAHYARNDELAAARRERRAVKALCGTFFHPHLNPERLPVCVVCEDLAAAWRGGDAGR